jgi:hypothetical protein
MPAASRGRAAINRAEVITTAATNRLWVAMTTGLTMAAVTMKLTEAPSEERPSRCNARIAIVTLVEEWNALSDSGG